MNGHGPATRDPSDKSSLRGQLVFFYDETVLSGVSCSLPNMRVAVFNYFIYVFSENVYLVTCRCVELVWFYLFFSYSYKY